MNKSSSRPIAVAVVGHTNAGKTSLLRTLSRDKNFGNVSGQPGQTRHVEATSVSIDGRPVLKLFDTPGFEDSIALQEYLKQFENRESRRSSLAAFLGSPEAKGRFVQEAKILGALLGDIDAAFYVVDTTETPHAKFRSELDILASCAVPIMPVLNFTGHPDSRLGEWKSVLADRGLHVQVAFDVIAPLAGSERRLYEQLASLLGEHRAKLESLVVALANESKARSHASFRSIGDLLVDVAAYRTQVVEKNDDEIAREVSELQSKVRQREQRCADALLSIYRFDRNDLEVRDLPLLSERIEDDLFNPEVLKQTARRLGRGAAIGALVGLAADIGVAGISLGSGAVIGGAVGGMVVSSWKKSARWVKEKINGYTDLTVDDSTLLVLLGRQLQLLTSLQGRTHAANERLVLDGNPALAKALEPVIEKTIIARGHPDWSRLSDGFMDESDRVEVVESIADGIGEIVV